MVVRGRAAATAATPASTALIASIIIHDADSDTEVYLPLPDGVLRIILRPIKNTPTIECYWKK